MVSRSFTDCLLSGWHPGQAHLLSQRRKPALQNVLLKAGPGLCWEHGVKWTESFCLESKASAFNHMLVQNTYTPFLDLWGTQPPWESCAVPFTPQIALFFCWLYSWLTFPLHAHILTGRSVTNTVNLGWKLSWFLTHFFSGQNSGRTLGFLLQVPWCWTHSTGQVQALLQALGKYLLSSSMSAGEIQFLIIEDKISHFLTGYPSWINFWKLDTFCYEKSSWLILLVLEPMRRKSAGKGCSEHL